MNNSDTIRFDNQTVVITGAGAGLGRAFCTGLPRPDPWLVWRTGAGFT